MSEVFGRAYSVQAFFRALRSFPVISWSGSFVASLVYQIGARPMSVSPLYVDRRPLLTGRLGDRGASWAAVPEGSSVSFRVTFDSVKSLDSLLSDFRSLEARGLRLERLDVEEVKLPKDPLGIEEDRVLIAVEYLPTIYTFRSWRILYPSPHRLIYSAALTASKLTGVDLRKAAMRLAKRVELLNASKITIEKYSIGEKGGKERVVKAFRGTAVYGVYGAKNAEVFAALVKLAEKTNIGKSRGIGFGQVKLKPIKQQKHRQ